jgi:hypothetical protein
MSQLVMAAIEIKKYNPRIAKVKTTKIRIDWQTDILFLKQHEFSIVGLRAFAVFSSLFSLYLDSASNPE